MSLHLEGRRPHMVAAIAKLLRTRHPDACRHYQREHNRSAGYSPGDALQVDVSAEAIADAGIVAARTHTGKMPGPACSTAINNAMVDWLSPWLEVDRQRKRDAQREAERQAMADTTAHLRALTPTQPLQWATAA